MNAYSVNISIVMQMPIPVIRIAIHYLDQSTYVSNDFILKSLRLSRKIMQAKKCTITGLLAIKHIHMCT